MLRMENVTKKYRHRGQLVTALDGATVSIAKGDFVAVVGPSGSGKSTLLLMLGGMLSPSSGRVLLEGQSIYDLSTDQRARLEKTEGRLRLPDVQPGHVSFGVGERARSRCILPDWTTGPSSSGPRPCWSGSDWPTGCITSPAS